VWSEQDIKVEIKEKRLKRSLVESEKRVPIRRVLVQLGGKEH